ncbi:MAG: rhodanese-like domain-containing protein [Betaproteobacteria bacterium]|nr:MAG: rhodanese-like domain-containing protein [Betaproteobacteria bacterium]
MTFRKTSLVVAVALASAFALSPVVQAQNYPPAVSQLVAATKKQVKTISMAEFKAAFDRNALGTIVDVREPEEYADGFIPGAVNVPRGLLEFTIWKHVGFPDKTDMAKQMTLYCKTGGRCALATKSLMELGFTNVTSADMKIEDWQKAGYPLAKPKAQ